MTMMMKMWMKRTLTEDEVDDYDCCDYQVQQHDLVSFYGNESHTDHTAPYSHGYLASTKHCPAVHESTVNNNTSTKVEHPAITVPDESLYLYRSIVVRFF